MTGTPATADLNDDALCHDNSVSRRSNYVTRSGRSSKPPERLSYKCDFVNALLLCQRGV